MPLTVLICASCEVSSAFCIGLSGSWLFSWVTSSLRKRCSMSALEVALLIAAAALAALEDEAAEVSLTAMAKKSPLACARAGVFNGMG